jgi:hypothetical protein
MSPGRTRLADHLASLDAARFAGRARILAWVERLLAGRTATRVMLVYGPGGIGKSALLREIGRRAAAAGRPVLALDARGLEPVPGELEKALEGAMDQPRAVVVLDSFERIAAQDSLLRQRILPGLAADAVVVVAGRQAPSRTWFRDGWEHVAAEVPLGPLPSEDAHALLAARGVTDPDRAGRLVDWAGGSPLALNLAVSTGAPTDRSEPSDLSEPSSLAGVDLNRMIVQRLAGDELGEIDGEVVEVTTVARAVDARLLAAVLPGRPTRAANEALRRCTVTELVGARVTLHDLVRSALRDDMRRRDPGRYGELRCRIADHLYTRATAGELRLLSDLIELIDNPGVRWGIGGDAVRRFRIDPWRPDEVDELVEGYLAIREDPGAWDELAPLLAYAPETGLVARDPDGAPVGFSVAMPAGRAPAAAEGDPVLGPVLADARTQGAEQAMVFRESFAVPGPSGEAASAALHLSAVLRSGLPNVDRSYILDTVPHPDSMAFFQAVGAVHHPHLDTEVAGRPVAWWIIDHGPGGILGQVRDAVYAEAGAPAPSTGQRRVEDLHRAALDALRDFNRPDALAANPLAGLPRDPDALRARVLRAVEAAFGSSSDDRLLRQAVELADLDADVTHDQAMLRLSVSRATYFRYLRQARQRVAATLVDQVHGG